MRKLGLSKMIELLKNNVYSKLKTLDSSYQLLDQKVIELGQNFHEHTVSINEVHPSFDVIDF